MGMMKYKIDILDALKTAGWTTYRIKQERVLAEATLQSIREGKIVSWRQIGRVCDLLQCQPGDLLFYDPDAETPQVHSNLPGQQDDKKGDAE